MGKTITAIKVQKKNLDRVNIYLDGKFAFGLARIVAAWLQVGQELEESKIAQLQAEDELEKAYQRALNFLSYRMRTEDEVRINLQKKDLPEAVIESVVEKLNRKGFLNDRRFAQAWVENRSELSPRGVRALRYELRQKQVDPVIIDEILQDIDETPLALAAGRKRARRLRPDDRQEFRKKLSGFLARRGFNYGVVAPVVDQLWEELASEAEDRG
jgi:regulatory protein